MILEFTPMAKDYSDYVNAAVDAGIDHEACSSAERKIKVFSREDADTIGLPASGLLIHYLAELLNGASQSKFVVLKAKSEFEVAKLCIKLYPKYFLKDVEIAERNHHHKYGN